MNIDWPTASVVLGTLGTVVVGMIRFIPRREKHEEDAYYAKATDMADIRARFDSLERVYKELRRELRDDIKNLEKVILRSLQK